MVLAITAAQLNIRFNSEGASQVKSDLQGVGQGVTKAATGFDKMKGAALGIGTALIVPMGIGLKAAVALEQSIANVNASLGGLDSGTLDKLSASFQKIGADSQFSATEVATMADELAKAGFGAEDLLGGMTQSVVELAQATGDGLGPALDGVVQAMSTWKPGIVDATIAMTDASRVADILTTAANSSKAGIGDINAGMRSLGPVAAMLGIPFEDAAAGIALFTNNGLKGADAGVSLARGLQNLAAPSASVETGLADLGLSMEGLGIAAFDASGEFVGMPTLFRQLQAGLGDLDQQTQLAALSTIFGAEAMDVMGLAILQGAEPLEAIIELMGESGTAAEQSALRMDTLGAQFDTLKEGVTTFLGSLVQGLIPGMRMVVDTANVLVDVLMKIPAPIKTIIGAIAGVLAAFAAVNIAMTTSAALSGMLGISFAGVGASLMAILPIVLAVAAVAGALYLAWKTNFLGIRDVVTDFVDGLKRAFDPASNMSSGLERSIRAIQYAFGSIGLNTVAFGIKQVADFVRTLTLSFKELTSPVSKVTKTINQWGGIADKATKPMNVLSAGMKALSVAIKGINGGDLPDWLETIADGLDTGADAVQGFLDAFTDTWDSLGPATVMFGEFGVTIDRIGGSINVVSRFLYSLADGLRRLNDGPRLEWIGNVATVLDTLAAAIDELVGRFQGLRALGLNPVSAALIAIGTTFERLGPLMNDIAGYVGSLTDAFSSFMAGDFSAGFASMGDAIVSLANAWKEIGSLALDVVVSIGSWVFEQAVDLGSAFASWITDTAIPAIDRTARSLGTMAVSIADWAVDALIDLGGKVSSWITDTALPAVDKAARSLGTFVVEIAGWLVTASIDLGTKVGTWIRDTALPGVDKAARDLGTFLVNIAGWLVTTTIDLGTKVGAWIRDTALPAVDKTARDLGTFIVNIAGWLVTATIDLGTKVGQWIRDTALPAVNKAARDLGTFIVNIAGWLVTETISLGLKVSAWITDTAIPSVNKAARDLGTFIVSIGGWLVTQTTDLATSIKSKITEWLNALNITSTDVITVATKLGTALNDAIALSLTTLSGLNTKIYDWLTEQINGVDWNSVGSSFGTLFVAGVKATAMLIGFGAYLLGQVLLALVEVDWGSVASSFGTLFMAAVKAIGNFFVGWSTTVYDEIVAELGNVDWAAVGGVINEGLLGIGELINTGVKALFDVAMDGITAYLGEKLNPLIEDVNGLIEGLNKLPGIDIPEIAFFGQTAEDANAAKVSVDDLIASIESLGRGGGGGSGEMEARAGFESAGPGGGGRGSGAGRGAKGESMGGGSGQFAGMLAEIQSVTTALTTLGQRVATTTVAFSGFYIAMTPIVSGLITLGMTFTQLHTVLTTVVSGLITTGLTFTQLYTVMTPIVSGLITLGLTFTQLYLVLTTTVSGLITLGLTFTQLYLVLTTTVSGLITLGLTFTQLYLTMTPVVSGIITVGSTFTQLYAVLTTVVSGLITTGSTFTQLGAVVTTFGSTVSTTMGVVTSAVSTGMSDASSAISTEAGSWPGLVSAVEGSMRSAGVGVGAAASSGVADGILSVMWRVTAAANMIVNEVQRAMNAKARIASPSKMTAHIGMMLGEGLALGIDHMIPTVISKAQQMVESLKDVMSASMPNPLDGLTGLVSEGDSYFKRQIGVLGGAIIGDWEKLTQGFWRNISSGMVQKGILAEDGSYVNPGFYKGKGATGSIGYLPPPTRQQAPYAPSAPGGSTFAPTVNVTVNASGNDLDEEKIADLAAVRTIEAIEAAVRQRERSLGVR